MGRKLTLGMAGLGGMLTLASYAAAMATLAPELILRPRAAHWVPLLAPTALLIVLGLADLWHDPVVALPLLGIAAAVVGYNATARLRVGESISFSRYGRKVWTVGASGVRVSSGRCGEIPILPAFTLTDKTGASGSFPKAMLAPWNAERLKALVEARGGQWDV